MCSSAIIGRLASRVHAECRELLKLPDDISCVLRSEMDETKLRGTDGASKPVTPVGRALPPSMEGVEFVAHILGPTDTPYEGGEFELYVWLGPNYPVDPPNVRFVTRVLHPNIDPSGRICLDLLKTGAAGTWSFESRVKTVLIAIRELLRSPNAEDPLDADVANLYIHSRASFNAKARSMTLEYAVPKTKQATLNAADNQSSDIEPQVDSASVVAAPPASPVLLPSKSESTLSNELPRPANVEQNKLESIQYSPDKTKDVGACRAKSVESPKQSPAKNIAAAYDSPAKNAEKHTEMPVTEEQVAVKIGNDATSGFISFARPHFLPLSTRRMSRDNATPRITELAPVVTDNDADSDISANLEFPISGQKRMRENFDKSRPESPVEFLRATIDSCEAEQPCAKEGHAMLGEPENLACIHEDTKSQSAESLSTSTDLSPVVSQLGSPQSTALRVFPRKKKIIRNPLFQNNN